MPAGALLLSVVLSATSVPLPHTAHAVRVVAGPTVDGDLSDAAWKSAPVEDGFLQEWPQEHKAPLGSTTVQIVYDDKAVYFAFHCVDPNPSGIVARYTRRDTDTQSDAVLIDLDTEGDHQRAFHFEVSAAGIQRDAIRTGDSAIDYDWDAVWRSAVHRTFDGWDAEIAIPFGVLRYDPKSGNPWRLQLRRYVSRLNETDAWVFIPATTEGELLRYGELDGIQPPPPSHHIVLEPYVGGRLRSQYTPSSVGGPNGFDATGTAGLDAALGITPELNLQLTVLPDFGQVEADPAVLNLTTYELHLAEQRPFFLEGADLFENADTSGNAVTNQLFYSRRLGATPDAPTLPTGAIQTQLPDAASIWGAAKMTGEIGHGISIALLDGMTAEDSAAIRLSNGNTAIQELAPLSNFLVGRLRAPVGGNVTTGVTLTDVAREEKPQSMIVQGLCPDGGPPGSDGRCTHDAQALSADLQWQPKNGDYAATAQVLGSHLTGGPDRMGYDGTWIGGGTSGFGARAQASKLSGNFVGDVSFETMSPTLDINDAGYQPNQNYRTETGDIGWRTFAHGSLLMNKAVVGVSETDSWRGILLNRGFWTSDVATLRSEWNLGVGGGGWTEAYDIRGAENGTPVQRPGGWWGSAWGNSNPTLPMTFNWWGAANTTWKGYGLNGGLGLNARFLQRFELSIGPQANWQTGDPRWIDTTGSSYLFGLQDAFSASTILRSTVAFTPTLTLQGYSQLFFASVRYDQLYNATATPDLLLANLNPDGESHAYDSRDALLNLSLVLRWEYLPGAALYLVYTHTQDGGVLPMPTGPDGEILPARNFDWEALQHGQTQDELLAKISYYWGT